MAPRTVRCDRLAPRDPGLVRACVGLVTFGVAALMGIAAPWVVERGGSWCTEHPRLSAWLPLGPQCRTSGEAQALRHQKPSVRTLHPGRLLDGQRRPIREQDDR